MKQSPELSVSVGVGMIITRDDSVLLLRRKGVHGEGTWSTPGGHLEFGESFEECAVREAKEETNIEVTNVQFRAVTNDVFAAERKHYVTIWMEAKYSGGEAIINAAYEVADVGWFPWDALPQPLFSPFRHLLEGKAHPG